MFIYIMNIGYVYNIYVIIILYMYIIIYKGDEGNSDNEVQRTMLQIVTELDGFDARGNIKVLMATNRPDTLDPALLRPGIYYNIYYIYILFIHNMCYTYIHNVYLVYVFLVYVLLNYIIFVE